MEPTNGQPERKHIECRFFPLAPEQENRDETEFRLSGTTAEVGWSIIDCSWLAADGEGSLDTPFAQMAVRKISENEANATFILLTDRNDLDELLPRLLSHLSEATEEQLGAQIVQCMIYQAVSQPTNPPPFIEGQCTLQVSEHSEACRSHHLQFIPQEDYDAENFVEENYSTLADLDTFTYGEEAEEQLPDAAAPIWNLFILSEPHMNEKGATHLAEFLLEHLAQSEQPPPTVTVFFAKRIGMAEPSS